MNIPNPQIKSNGATAQIRWSPEFLRNVENTFGRGGQLQRFVDATIFESIEPYVPHDTGTMYRSAAASAARGEGLIVWRSPQVRLLYNGIVYVDPKTRAAGFLTPEGWRSRRGVRKVPSGRPFKFQGGGKRGSFWTERWKRDNLTAFEKNLQLKAGELLRLG